MSKYEYAFERIRLEDYPLIGLDTEAFRKVLQAKGQEGWIYSGYLHIRDRGVKLETEVEVIFRREIPENE